MQFIKTKNNKNVFRFVCEGCQSEGELTIESDALHVPCPEHCGAMYVQWHNPITDKPDLMCVVCPVFERTKEE